MADEYRVILKDQDAGIIQVEFYEPTEESACQAARHVLYVLEGDREVGQDPGGYMTKLIEAMCHADKDNRARLTLVYGALMTSVHIYKNIPGGVEILRRLAKTPATHPGDGFSPKGN